MSEFLNEEKIPFKDLTPEQRNVIITAWLNDELERYDELKRCDHQALAWKKVDALKILKYAIYRTKQQPYKLFGIEIEGEPPLREALEYLSIYYYVDFSLRDIATRVWDRSDVDYNLLAQGLCFATKEGAMAAARALGVIEEQEQ